MLDSGAEGPRFKSQPQRCWVKVTCRASVNQAAKVVAALLMVARVTACLAERQTKHPNSAFLSPATLPHQLHTYLLLLPLPLISQSSPLPHNPKSTRSCPAVQTSNLTQIRSPPGLLKNAHQFLFPQSPILSTFPSSPASFTPLSRNPLSHHCLRNRHWIKKNSRTIGPSRICLSFPK